MAINTGGSAFPALNFVVPYNLNKQGVQRLGETQGMTLRDYFAAKALQGMLANNERDTSFSCFADDAYKLADAMLKERNNEQ